MTIKLQISPDYVTDDKTGEDQAEGESIDLPQYYIM